MVTLRMGRKLIRKATGQLYKVVDFRIEASVEETLIAMVEVENLDLGGRMFFTPWDIADLFQEV